MGPMWAGARGARPHESLVCFRPVSTVMGVRHIVGAGVELSSRRMVLDVFFVFVVGRLVFLALAWVSVSIPLSFGDFPRVLPGLVVSLFRRPPPALPCAAFGVPAPALVLVLRFRLPRLLGPPPCGASPAALLRPTLLPLPRSGAFSQVWISSTSSYFCPLV